MIAVEIVILDVRNAEEAGKYALDMTIDGVRETFVFGDSTASATSLSYDRRYEEIFTALAGSRQIGRFVLDFRGGKKLDLPETLQVFRLERGEKPPSFRR